MAITFTHDHMIQVIVEQYPELVHGRDFMVAHYLDLETGEQKGDPFIMQWKRTDIPQPDVAELTAKFKADPCKYHAALVRGRRNRLLSMSDSKATAPADAPAAIKAKAASWQQYRQALRDLTTQEGFPESVQWPVAPK